MLAILSFLIGISIGSFLNAVIFRAHKSRSVWKGRSKCMSCLEPIDWFDLVPIVSYLRLRGRCRRCRAVIDWQYPAVELVTGVLFVLAYVLSPGELSIVLRNWIFIAYLVILFVYDLRYQYILDRFTIPAMMVAVIANLWIGTIPAWSLTAGALVLGSFFALQHIVSKGTWIGGGDIRMGILIGCMLGLAQGLMAIFLAYFVGAIISVVLLATRKVHRKTQIPLGTFLALATLFSLFFGQPTLDWYLGFFA